MAAERFQQRHERAALVLCVGGCALADQGIGLFLPLPEQGGGQLAAKAGLELGAGAKVHGG